MKLTIEVELQPDEIPLATEMFNLLRQISQHVKPKNAGQLFSTLICKLEDASQLDAVVADVNNLFQEGGVDVIDDFFNSFVDVVFNSDLVSRNQSVVPYFYLLPRIAEPQRTNMRDKLLARVLKSLTVKRSIDCNRMEFFSYAEAFATMAKLEFVSISGAVNTITTLLSKAETRCAAITMLGKTVELCLNLLNEKCDPTKLQELRLCLQTQVIEEVFRYDVNYIEDNMNWKSAPPPTASMPSTSKTPQPDVVKSVPTTATAAGLNTLVATTSFTGHQSTIFTICYDELRDQIVSSGKDSLVIVWGRDGKQKERLSMPRHYACSMDINSKHKSIFLCGVAKEAVKDSVNPAIISYNLNDKGSWTLRGTLERESVKLVSCVKALVQDAGNNFVTGESSKSSPMEREKVRFYDANSNSFDKLQPLITYEEHEDIITSLTHFPNADGLFFSGSRDCTIKLWDKRQSKSVGTFGVFTSTAGRVCAHEGMITCLDAFDTILVSSGLDKKVVVWDIRTLDSNSFTQPLRRISVDENPVLKVAVGPSSLTAAVSTLKGLYLVEFNGFTSKPATQFKDRRPVGRYHDLKWNIPRGILYAAGDDMRVDVFTAQAQNW